jgi:PAS domain S-box-containing protein
MWGRLRHWLKQSQRSETNSQNALLAALAREEELADVYASLGKTVVDLAQANEELEREVAERRRAEAALREREATLESIFAASPDIIAIVEIDGRVRMINPAIREILGYAPEAWVGKNALGMVHAEAHNPLAYMFRTLVAGRCHETTYTRLRCRHAEGFWKILEANGRVIVDYKGVPDAVVIVARDVTEQVRLEETLRQSEERFRSAAHIAEAASQAKSQILSRMSHNLRTPLNSVLGFAQLLQMGDLSDEQRESVEYILLAGRHLLDLINEVLDLSRIEAGGLALAIEPIQLADLLSEARDLIQPALSERGIALRFDGAARDATVLADRQRLRQVLLNLLSNAIKYNRPGGIVRIDWAATECGRVRVRVSDEGPGIAPQYMARLFTPFDRLGAETSGIEGTGLGLVLSRQLIEAMGGTIGVESRVGNGSTFWFEISRYEDQPGQQRSETRSGLVVCEREQMA